MNSLLCPNKMCNYTCFFAEPTDYLPACRGKILAKHHEPVCISRSSKYHFVVLPRILPATIQTLLLVDSEWPRRLILTPPPTLPPIVPAQATLQEDV